MLYESQLAWLPSSFEPISHQMYPSLQRNHSWNALSLPHDCLNFQEHKSWTMLHCNKAWCTIRREDCPFVQVLSTCPLGSSLLGFRGSRHWYGESGSCLHRDWIQFWGRADLHLSYRFLQHNFGRVPRGSMIFYSRLAANSGTRLVSPMTFLRSFDGGIKDAKCRQAFSFTKRMLFSLFSSP